MTQTSFLFELDRITNEIVGKIISNQSLSVPGDKIPIEGTTEKIIFPQNFSAKETRKIRSQFIKISEMNPPNLKDIPKLFVIYLNSNFE